MTPLLRRHLGARTTGSGAWYEWLPSYWSSMVYTKILLRRRGRRSSGGGRSRRARSRQNSLDPRRDDGGSSLGVAFPDCHHRVAPTPERAGDASVPALIRGELGEPEGPVSLRHRRARAAT